MGSGIFFGMMPDDLAQASRLAGVEMDSLTGRMAKQLYQNADIRVSPFQDVGMPDNHYDLFISNVPFADVRITDNKLVKTLSYTLNKFACNRRMHNEPLRCDT